MAEKSEHFTNVKSSERLDHLASVRSASRFDIADHQINLEAVTSSPVSLGEVAEELTSDQKFYIIQRLGYEDLKTLDDLPPVVIYMLEKIASLNPQESVEILKKALDDHHGDVNVPTEITNFYEALVAYNDTRSNMGFDVKSEKHDITEMARSVDEDSMGTGSTGFEIVDWELQVRTEAGIVAYWSIYSEVRAVAKPYDDPSVSCETFRVYLLSFIWVIIGGFIDQYFSQRQPNITLQTSVVQLLVFPCGKFLEKVLPAWDVKLWRGWKFNLNPGPWTGKEQMLTTLAYSVTGGTIYVSYNLHVLIMDRYYGVKWVDFGYQVLLMLATSYMGFGIAGIVRKFVVYPENCLWPSILPTIALNKALCEPEKKSKINGWTISSYAFFLVTFAASFVYFWVPDYLFTALSRFNWIAWIAPNNFNLATITGIESGMGLNPISTFDWNVINNYGPLNTPFFATFNYFIGSIIAMFCICGVWWTNYKWTGYLPINQNSLFTNTGEYYKVSAVVNSEYTFDQEKYDKVGPPFYTAAQLVYYGAFFALYPFTIFYTLIMNFKQISFATKGFYKLLKSWKTSTYEGFEDPFSRSMSRYKEVPEWWFTLIMVGSIVLAILAAKLYPSDSPVWTIFFAIGINFVFLIPIAIVYSQTGYSFGLNVLVELIMGYALPGNGLGLNFAKAFGYVIDGQADNYITNQKQAHYMRIPPRALFRIQMLTVLLVGFVQLGTFNLQIRTIEDYCMPHQPQSFTCPGATNFYSASILWGIIGPRKVFGGLYPILQWCFLIGFLLVFPMVLLKHFGRRYEAVKYFHPVIVINGFLAFAPYNISWVIPGVIAGFCFMHIIRYRYTGWWTKYNYILSGGLSAGVAFSSIIIFFAVQYTSKDLNWWGNDVNSNGLDWIGPSRLNATTDAPGGYFGPRIGSFP